MKAPFKRFSNIFAASRQKLTSAVATPPRSVTANPALVEAHEPRPRKDSLSSVSSYSSDYSDSEEDISEDISNLGGVPPVTVKRRPTSTSHGAGDRRRVAIVQMDTSSTSESTSSSSSLRSRHRLASLALVAPPDAAPQLTLDVLAPPSSTLSSLNTPIDTKTANPVQASMPAEIPDKQHRDGSSQAVNSINNTTNSDTFDSINDNNALAHVPCALPPAVQVVQQLQGLLSTSTCPDSLTTFSTPMPPTPAIGASKDIHVPVAPPVLIELPPPSTIKLVSAPNPTTPASKLSKSTPSHSRNGSSVFDVAEAKDFLSYQPGFHSTAGPLPPPPRAMFSSTMLASPPPPRPPRLHSPTIPPRTKTDLEAVKQALQLPPSVTAKLAKTTPPPPLEVKPLKLTHTHVQKREVTPKSSLQRVLDDTSSYEFPKTKSVHRREGAFPPSSSGPSTEDTTLPAEKNASTRSRARLASMRSRPTLNEGDDGHVPDVTIVKAEVKDAKTDEQEIKELVDTFEESYQRLYHAHSHSTPLSHVRWPSSDGSLSLSERSVKRMGSSLRDDGPSPPTSGTPPSAKSPLPHYTQSHLGHGGSGGGGGGGGGHYRTQSQRRSISPRSVGSATSSVQSGAGGSTAPSPPPKSFRNSLNLNLTSNLKRLSHLPRTPSRGENSLNRSPRQSEDGDRDSHRRSPTGTHFSQRSASRTPSPTVPLKSLRVRKIIDYNPPAMFCHEVYQQRTPAERCQIYIEKINELYLHDCGLQGWLMEMQYRSTASQQPRGPSAAPFSPKPRQTSGSSMQSEVTFARRPDATIATDLLAPRPSPSFELSPAAVEHNLPYPVLASQQRQQSIRSTASSTAAAASVRSAATAKTGFFASLGRRTSISGGKRPDKSAPALLIHSNPSAASSRATLTPKPAQSSSLTREISRPLLVSSGGTSNHGHGTPSPSGPRALPPPNRAQRSKTLISHAPRYNTEREEAIGRRPSLFDLGSSAGLEWNADPEFAQQVDKLHSLLPHADRAILAGYLRRAGQDVLAIGQYLDDERNGTLKPA